MILIINFNNFVNILKIINLLVIKILNVLKKYKICLNFGYLTHNFMIELIIVYVFLIILSNEIN